MSRSSLNEYIKIHERPYHFVFTPSPKSKNKISFRLVSGYFKLHSGLQNVEFVFAFH